MLLYGSTTPGAIPSASKLVTNDSGVELALNAADGKLFFKDAAGFVRVIADANGIGASGTADINSGTIDGTAIGSSDPSTGAFTTLVTGALSVPTISGLVKSNGSLGFSAAVAGVDYVDGAAVGVANGVASLDSTGKIPLSQLPAASTGGLVYLGTWNATTNTPNLVSGVGTKGFFYKVSVAGSTTLDGTSTWSVGDQVIFNGTIWERVQDSSAPVQSVNGMTGVVVLTRASLGAAASGANTDITSLTGLTTALSVGQGGTGRSTITGIIKGNGTSAFSTATAGTDYAVPPTGTASQLLANNGTGGFTNVVVGAGLAYSGGVLTATGGGTGGGGGSVTLVDVSGGTTGLTFSGGPITTSGTLTMSGTLAVANGGTGRTTLSGMLKGNGTAGVVTAVVGTDYAAAPTGTAAQLLANNGSGGFTNVVVGTGLAYSGGTLSSTSSGGTVTSVQISGGTSGLNFSGGPITTTGTITLSGRLAVANGGTGVATLIGIVKGNGSAAFSAAVAGTDYAAPPNGTTSQLLANNGAGGFSNVSLGSGLSLIGGVLSSSGGGGSGTVTSVQMSGGTTGLVFSGGPITTTGTITLAGILSVTNGGTGVGTISGLVKGNGTSAMTAASPGVDYAVPPNGAAAQLLANNGVGGFSNVTVGAGLSYSGGTLTATATSGTVPDGYVTDIKVAANAMIQSTKLAYQLSATGSVSRTVASKFGDFVSVKDFGAVGNGVADDSDAVNSATTYAKSINGSVYFPPGSYNLPTLPTQSGRVIWWAPGKNVVLKGNILYQHTNFPVVAPTTSPVDSTAPFFYADGIVFVSVGLNYGLRIFTNEQPSMIRTFSLRGCEFRGYGGLQCRHAVGFDLAYCDFYTTARGMTLEGCAKGHVHASGWYNQAATGTYLTYASDHGSSGLIDRKGGQHITFSQCVWFGCVYGVQADMVLGMSFDTCVGDQCAIPLALSGCQRTKMEGSFFGASNAPVSALSGVTGYQAPTSSGRALSGVAGGYTTGDTPIGVTAHNCEFSNAVVGSTAPIAYVDGYVNGTYPTSADYVSFMDCVFSHAVGVTHSAQTILYIRGAKTAKVVMNRFVSQNVSTSLTDSWRAELSTDHYGILNDFSTCTQSNNVVGSSYEKLLATVYIQASDPGAVGPGAIWVQP